MSVKRLGKLAVISAVVTWGSMLAIVAQTTMSVGAVRLPRAVMANGEPLAAGTYLLRLTPETVTPVVGQAAEGARWVEFVQGDTVRGRELATVIPAADVKAVAKGTPPPSGTARVQMLRGADYLRVWANLGGTQYLVHLTVSAPK